MSHSFRLCEAKATDWARHKKQTPRKDAKLKPAKSLILDVQVFVNLPNFCVGKIFCSSEYKEYACGQTFFPP